MTDGRPDRAGRGSIRRRAACFVALGLLGCSTSPEPISIVPDSAKGRQAVEAAMATWKAGHAAGVVEPTSPRVLVIDTHRKPGQRLDGFEVLGESADSRGRTFQVRLALNGPDERPVVGFLVVGIDPVNVFRAEDYELLMHWEHRMDPEPGQAGAAPVPLAR